MPLLVFLSEGDILLLRGLISEIRQGKRENPLKRWTDEGRKKKWSKLSKFTTERTEELKKAVIYPRWKADFILIWNEWRFFFLEGKYRSTIISNKFFIGKNLNQFENNEFCFRMANNWICLSVNQCFFIYPVLKHVSKYCLQLLTWSAF